MTRSTFVNALIGAVVSFVLSFVPFSPVLGGAVAAYLEGRDGVRVGAISGLVAALPVAAFVFLLASLFLFGDGLGLFVLIGVVVLVAVVYTVALSALGGYLGEYLVTRQAERREVDAVRPSA